jgi:hypothetical protein
VEVYIDLVLRAPAESTLLLVVTVPEIMSLTALPHPRRLEEDSDEYPDHVLKCRERGAAVTAPVEIPSLGVAMPVAVSLAGITLGMAFRVICGGNIP